MAFFDKFDKEHWYELSKAFEAFKPYPLTQDDIDRSLLIADEILNKFEERTLVEYPPMTFGNVLQGAATVYYNLGMHSSAKRAVSILSHIQYQNNDSMDIENLTVQSLAIKTGATVCKQPYYVEVPKVFNASSIHFMAHEIAHMLKESNYLECKGVLSDAEVIPILVEMISAHKKGDNNVFKKRELLMLDIAYAFKKLHEDLENDRISKEDMESFIACYRYNILYLNSFYYALRLFAVYLQIPQYVLGIVEDVLNQRLTTRDVINYYLSNDDYTYETGIDQFRSKLK